MAESGPAVRIEALGPRACLRLQGWASEEVERSLTSIASAGVRVLPLAPGDCLLLSSGHSGLELRQLVASYLPADGHALVDQSNELVAFEVVGVAARELISKGCGLDFHPQSFTPGQSARTRLAGIPVVVSCGEDPARFELMVARSYGQYLHDWLSDAAREFGSWQVESI